MKKTALLCFVVILFGVLSQDPSEASVSAQSLTLQPSARSAGMADCTMAVLNDGMAASWNPGGLAFVQDRLSVVTTYTQLFPDTAEDIYYVHAAPAFRITPEITVAGTFLYFSLGEVTIIDPYDSEGERTDEFYELAPSLACAAAIGDVVGLGVNVKYVRVDLPWHASGGNDESDYVGSAFGVDFGGEARIPAHMDELDLLLRFAGAVRNLGTDVEFGDSDLNGSLPRAMSVGVSGQLTQGDLGSVLVCGQYDRSLVDGFGPYKKGRLGAGVELNVSLLGILASSGSGSGLDIRDNVSARLGYEIDMDYEEDGISFGLGGGVEWDERFEMRLDLANVPMPNDFTRPWRIQGSLSAQF